MSNYYNHDVTNGRTDLDDIAPLDISGQQNVFTDWLSPNQKERRQMEEQLIMEKLTPEARLEGMKRAGINPNTAAAGIAGSSATLPQPSASTNPIGDIAGAAGTLIDSGTGIAGVIGKLGVDAATAENLNANTDKVREETPWIGRMMNSNILRNFGSFVTDLTGSGMAEIQAGTIGFDIANGGIQKAIDYLSLCSGMRSFDTKLKSLKADLDLKLKDLEFYDVKTNSQISLNEKMGLQATANALKMQAEKEYQDSVNSLFKDFPGCTLPGFPIMSGVILKHGIDSPQFNALENGIYKFSYQSSLGSFHADMDTAFNRAYNNAKAAADVNADYRPYLDFLDEMKDLFHEIISADLENPSSIKGMLGKLSNLVSTIPALQSMFNKKQPEPRRPAFGNALVSPSAQ